MKNTAIAQNNNLDKPIDTPKSKLVSSANGWKFLVAIDKLPSVPVIEANVKDEMQMILNIFIVLDTGCFKRERLYISIDNVTKHNKIHALPLIEKNSQAASIL